MSAPILWPVLVNSGSAAAGGAALTLTLNSPNGVGGSFGIGTAGAPATPMFCHTLGAPWRMSYGSSSFWASGQNPVNTQFAHVLPATPFFFNVIPSGGNFPYAEDRSNAAWGSEVYAGVIRSGSFVASDSTYCYVNFYLPQANNPTFGTGGQAYVFWYDWIAFCAY